MRLRGQGRKCALATIVDAHGSVPGYAAAKLLVSDDGSIAGTVGGGSVEAAVCAAAVDVMRTERPQRIPFDLGQDVAFETGLICGGRLEVFIEPILPAPRACIFGAGHISRSLSKLLALAGFMSVIVDNREEMATVERFPDAARVLVSEYEAIFPDLSITEETYLVIVTNSHRDDMRVLRMAMGSPARYVAMVGSKRKVVALTRELEGEGVSPSAFDRLYAPMGLNLGAQTPEEIAIAVAAEMIAVRRGAPSNWRSISLSIFAGASARAAEAR